MGKGHARNEDTYLNKGGANEISAAQLVNDLKNHVLNIMLNAFRIAQIGSLTIFNMVKGFMDEYEDESGIDLVNSINQVYDSIDDFYKDYSDIDSETKLLLHLNNNVTDSENTPKTVTNNNVTFSSSEKKFGSHAASFNGTTAHLSVPDSDDFNFGSGDFTIETWINFNSFITGQTPFQHGQVSGSTFFYFALYGSNFHLYVYIDAAEKLHLIIPNELTIGTWNHIAIICGWNGTSSLVSVCINGVSKATGTIVGGIMPNCSGDFGIGRDGEGTGFFNGYIDEFRISKGIARWTSNFTPPTMEYPISGNMTLLSNAQVATIVPIDARIVLFEEDVDSVTINTDLKAYVSRDNGTTYSQATLEDEGNYITGARILSGLVDISGQPSGSNMKYKIETLNTKKLNLHGVGISWK